uniref:Cystatin n=1 Tax=Haemaphysalis flava TaxID=181088 RepID=A0A6B9DA14_HAEFA|nr:cystatin [Haemaphysalis flava]
MALSGATAFTLVLVLTGFLLCCFAEHKNLKGGWRRQNQTSDEHYHSLAHFAVAKQVDGREFFDTVLEITDVETQTVAGTNYRITFKTTESTCLVTETYSREHCRPKTQEVKDICTTVIYDVPWLNETSVTSYTCGTNAPSST